MTSRMSSSPAMRRAAGPRFSGNTGCHVPLPAANRSSHTSLGNEKCAAWSPCRWPSSRRPTRKANSPRRPGPASTPGQEVTSCVMSSLAVCAVVMGASCTLEGPGRQGQLVLGRALHADERVPAAVGDVLVALGLGEARALVDPDRPGVERGDVQQERPGRREREPRLEELAAEPAPRQVGAEAEPDLLDVAAWLDDEEARQRPVLPVDGEVLAP